jgi:hypothetical protein
LNCLRAVQHQLEKDFDSLHRSSHIDGQQHEASLTMHMRACRLSRHSTNDCTVGRTMPTVRRFEDRQTLNIGSAHRRPGYGPGYVSTPEKGISPPFNRLPRRAPPAGGVTTRFADVRRDLQRA